MGLRVISVASCCFCLAYSSEYLNGAQRCMTNFILLSMPMGIDYVIIGFDMEVQPLVTHNAA